MSGIPLRLFLADHLLRDVVGHHLGYNLALADAASRAGIEPCLVTHRAFDATLANGVPCRKLFHTDFRAEPPPWISRNHRLLDLLERWCDWQFGRDLRRFSGAGAEDVVFAQMLSPRHFLHWLRWMSGRTSPPVLFLHLGYRPERFAATELRRTLGDLPPETRRRVALVTDSEKLVEPFETSLSSTVFYQPHVLSYPVPKPEHRPPDALCRVFVPGNARREKGFLESAGAAARILASGRAKDFRFSIQCHSPDHASAEVLLGAPPPGEGMEWISRPLGDGEYVQRLLAADAILLPYHLDLYSMRTSGIFCEARVAGKPVIASRGSWAGDRVEREGGGWLVEERNVDDLVRVLLTLPEEIASKREEALAISDSARAEFHRDNFMAGLQKIHSIATSEDY